MRANSPPNNGSIEHDQGVIDPMKGGAVSPKDSKQSKALEVEPGNWIWDGVVKVLEVDLFSPAWEVRHGAALALRELLKVQGKYGGMQGELSLKSENHEISVRFLQRICLQKKTDMLTKNGAMILPLSSCVSSC